MTRCRGISAGTKAAVHSQRGPSTVDGRVPDRRPALRGRGSRAAQSNCRSRSVASRALLSLRRARLLLARGSGHAYVVFGGDSPATRSPGSQRSAAGGEVVSASRLIDCVWDHLPPRSAWSSLQVHISRLRKTLGSRTIVRFSHGYALTMGSVQVDAAVFSSLAEQGRSLIERSEARRDREGLRQALALWRIVGELGALVLEHPRHEGLCARLMLALYRSGRHADALAVYREHADGIVETLGLQPSPALRALELHILRHDPELARLRVGPAPRLS